MATIHPDLYKRPAQCALKIISGQGAGNVYPIFTNESLTIGKDENCTIYLDTLSEKISYKHARLTAKEKHYLLENLSQANPTSVDNQPIDEIKLTKGQKFQIDDIIFSLEVPVFSHRQNKSSYQKGLPKNLLKFFLIGLLIVLLMFFSIMLFRGNEPDKKPSDDSGALGEISSEGPRKAEAATEEVNQEKQISANTAEVQLNNNVVGPASTKQSNMLSSGSNMQVTASRKEMPSQNLINDNVQKDKGAVEEKFREGMFFYENNNLKNAIFAWQKALILDPQHRRADAWMARAQGELDEKIDVHYRKGLRAKKYMRNIEAASEFRTVIELSIDKQNGRYIGAIEQLKSLPGEYHQ